VTQSFVTTVKIF